MNIANLKSSARKFGRAAIGIAAMCALQAMAQQQVPAPMSAPMPAPMPVEVPKAYVPAIKPPVAVMMPAYDSDDCGLSEVSVAELKAVRASILVALGSNSAAVTSFTNAEGKIPASCSRKRAAYYLRAIAQIQSAK